MALFVMPAAVASAQVNGLDLVFLMRITSEFHPERVEQSFRDAGAAANGEALTVRPISTSQYQLYKLMVTKPDSFVYGADLTPVVELDKQAGGLWRIHQKDPGKRLKGMWVQYSDEDGGESTVFHETQDSSSEDAAFRIVKQDAGNYLFQPKSDEVPVGYRLVGAAADETQLPETFKPWPAKNLHYIIRLEDFQGDESTLDRLKNNLQERANIQVLDSADGLFSFAAFRSVAAQIKDAWAENSYTITVGFLGGKQGQQPNKAWLLFPLTSDECDMAEKVLESQRHTEKTLADMLNNRRKSDHPILRAIENKATELPYRDVSAWHELSVAPGGFGRAFRLDAGDLPRWRRKYPSRTAHGLLIYEGSLFRDGIKIPNEPRVIPQQDINKGSMLWRRLELPNWQPGLEGMAL
ncbi:hypothetical protein N8510_00620 [bacterium]|nr:hypothetical protein [bacterium]